MSCLSSRSNVEVLLCSSGRVILSSFLMFLVFISFQVFVSSPLMAFMLEVSLFGLVEFCSFSGCAVACARPDQYLGMVPESRVTPTLGMEALFSHLLSTSGKV